ncbi:AEC family transporter [Kiloniella sp. b19]|uniref:AEC family transporter n=1 Tax=Kiloniella sp. GXU_MW_B19 TaxID=3141326 RepID=UPI0031D20A05
MIFILIYLAIGLLLGNSPRNQDGQMAKALATFAINVALPALILKHLHAIPLDSSAVLPMVAPFLVFFSAFVLVLGLWKTGRLDRGTAGCLVLVCGTGNTSIVGIPLIEAFYGAEATGYTVIFDQANFIVMTVLGLLAANYFSADPKDEQSIFRKIVTYPPMVATLAALALRPVDFPLWLDEGLTTLGSTLTPLAIVSVGASLRIREVAGERKMIALGLTGKLLLVPLLVMVLLLPLVNDSNSLAYQVSVLQAGMPPMIVAGIIAMEKNLNPVLSSALISLGIPVSFVTVYLFTLLL